MPQSKEEFNNSQEKEVGLENLEKEENINDLIEKDAEELKRLVDQSLGLDGGRDFAVSELSSQQQELDKINKEEEEALNDWQRTSEDIVSNNEFASVKESWRQSAEERFGIKDFDIEQFKRIDFDDKAVREAFAAGHEWNHIFDKLDEFTKGESYDQAVKAFDAMEELESLCPGSVKDFREKFGIANFQRYPKEILLDQLKDIDPQKEVGLMIFAVSDWNGAFDDQGKIWSKIYEQQKDKLNFRIAECHSNIDLARQLIKSKQDFGKKISFLSLSAHSEPEGFDLGKEGEKNSFVGKEDIIKLKDKMKEILAPNAQVMANACSSGSLNGWVRDLSKEAGIKVVGPDRPAAIGDVDFAGDEVVPQYYDSDIYSNYYKGFLLSKQRKNNQFNSIT